MVLRHLYPQFVGGVNIGQLVAIEVSLFPLGNKMLVGVFCVNGSHRILPFQVPLSDITACLVVQFWADSGGSNYTTAEIWNIRGWKQWEHTISTSESRPHILQAPSWQRGTIFFNFIIPKKLPLIFFHCSSVYFLALCYDVLMSEVLEGADYKLHWYRVQNNWNSKSGKP